MIVNPSFAASRCLFFVFYFFMMNAAFSQQRIEGLFYKDKKPIAVIVKDGKIVSIETLSNSSTNKNLYYIAPGLIDNQVNGFNGISFSSESSKITEESVADITQSMWKNGVTTYFPTVTTASHQDLLANFSALAKAKKNPLVSGSIPGFHLEGPYISKEDGYRGAHAEKFVRVPNWSEFMELYNASDKSIVTVTMAPETENALDFVERCTKLGIIVAIGHHNASGEVIKKAVDKGARICTHFGNGMANEINRHVNPLWPQLAEEKLMISIICDGFHLRPEEIKVFHQMKGSDKTIITSDVSEFAGMKPGIYRSPDGEDVEVTAEGEVRYPSQKVLYGSASALNKGVSHIMKVTSCTLEEAIRMASTNPAALYKLHDRGTIEAGKRADLILFSMNDEGMIIHKTFVQGKEVYSRP
jgi:N-acetylglucosamine-6-phosphate deacetylase